MATAACRVDLLLPGLFISPKDWLIPELDAELAGFKRLLTYAAIKSVPVLALEQQVLTLLGYEVKQGSESAAGRLSANAKGMTSSKFYLRADPVHFRVDRDSAYLLPAKQLQLTSIQSKELAASLNEHLQQHDLRLHFLSSNVWLLESSQAFELSTCTLDDAANKNVQVLLPKGKGAGVWNGLQTELQMLLHQHPVNQERAANGLATINSVWFWGSGVADTQTLDNPYDAIYADDFCVQGLSVAAGMPFFEVTEFNAQSIKADSLYLYQNSCLRVAANTGPTEWQQQLLAIEQQLISPLLSALKAGRVFEICLYTEGYQFSITAKRLAYFWKRVKTLNQFLAHG